MEHTALVRVEAADAQTLAHVLSWFSSEEPHLQLDALLEQEGALDPNNDGDDQYALFVLPEPEPEVYLGCGFRFSGAPLEELEAVASQRRFEKPAADWQQNTLWEVLDSFDDVVEVVVEENLPELDHYRLGRVRIDVE